MRRCGAAAQRGESGVLGGMAWLGSLGRIEGSVLGAGMSVRRDGTARKNRAGRFGTIKLLVVHLVHHRKRAGGTVHGGDKRLTPPGLCRSICEGGGSPIDWDRLG